MLPQNVTHSNIWGNGGNRCQLKSEQTEKRRLLNRGMYQQQREDVKKRSTVTEGVILDVNCNCTVSTIGLHARSCTVR